MNYHNITWGDLANGSGVRVVLWTAGCSHACPGCHNKQTWDPNGGIPFGDEDKAELFSKLNQDYVKGITFSGGDPLFMGNRETIGLLAKEIKEKFPEKDIWLYTGYTWNDIKDLEIMKYIDILVDGRFIMSLSNPSPHWRGSTNQRIIDVQQSLKHDILILSKYN